MRGEIDSPHLLVCPQTRTRHTLSLVQSQLHGYHSSVQHGTITPTPPAFSSVNGPLGACFRVVAFSQAVALVRQLFKSTRAIPSGTRCGAPPPHTPSPPLHPRSDLQSVGFPPVRAFSSVDSLVKPQQTDKGHVHPHVSPSPPHLNISYGLSPQSSPFHRWM